MPSLKAYIDAPFITRLEQKNPDVKFVRIDSDLTDSFKEETSDEEKETLKKDSESLTALFHKALNNDKLTVKAEKLKDASMACVMTLSEEGRRMQEMMKMYGMSGMDFGTPDETLVLNLTHRLFSMFWLTLRMSLLQSTASSCMILPLLLTAHSLRIVCLSLSHVPMRL